MIKTFVKECAIFMTIYIFWSILNVISNELHYKFCQPKQILYWLLIPFINETAHCRVLVWIQYNSRMTTRHLGLSCITWIIHIMTGYMKLIQTNTETKYKEM